MAKDWPLANIKPIAASTTERLGLIAAHDLHDDAGDHEGEQE